MHHPHIVPSLEASRQKNHRSIDHMSQCAFNGIPNWYILYFDPCINSHDIIWSDGNCIVILQIQKLLQWINLHPNKIGSLTTPKLVIFQVCFHVYALSLLLNCVVVVVVVVNMVSECFHIEPRHRINQQGWGKDIKVNQLVGFSNKLWEKMELLLL